MIEGLIGILLSANAGTALPVVASFESEAGMIELTSADIIDAAPQFGGTGPGLRIDFTNDAHARISTLVDESQGIMLRLLICGEVVLDADAPKAIPASISFPFNGLGAANWTAGILTGDRPC
ncbi:MAG: hypothetical protein HKO14_01165, partial [Silicimonas sp.]|nr:hypothetical protein [Silicimonas sp.]